MKTTHNLDSLTKFLTRLIGLESPMQKSLLLRHQKRKDAKEFSKKIGNKDTINPERGPSKGHHISEPRPLPVTLKTATLISSTKGLSNLLDLPALNGIR